MKPARALPVFSVAFAALYLLCMYENYALFSYFPRTGTFYPLTVTLPAAQNGPGMYWYGWIASATLGALVVAALSLVVPARFAARTWSGLAWAVPGGVMLFILFLLRGWFIR